MTDVPTGTAGESTWDQLRRRKVMQGGIFHAAGALELLEGFEYVTSTFDWPRQVLLLISEPDLSVLRVGEPRVLEPALRLLA